MNCTFLFQTYTTSNNISIFATKYQFTVKMNNIVEDIFIYSFTVCLFGRRLMIWIIMGI